MQRVPASSGKETESVTIEMEQKFMADFFEQVTSIKEDLSELRQDLDKFEKLKSRVINSPEAGRTVVGTYPRILSVSRA